MSGTSLDGVDLALCSISLEDSNWSYKIIKGSTIPYTGNLKGELANAIHLADNRIKELDIELGLFYADALNQFHDQNALVPEIISSHGHTIFHKPEKGFTLQIGNGREMANRTGITVVNNFRKKDMEHGGQGAPLVPVGDHLLFGNFDVCLNIGGIANLSYEQNGIRLAYDICPANIVLNYLSEKLGKSYDEDGSFAEAGSCSPTLLSKLNSLNYYALPPPKTLGKEWIEAVVFSLLEQSELSIKDQIATATEHIAFQIGKVLLDIEKNSILSTGGGVLNRFLMDRIRQQSGIEIELPDKSLIEYKESLVFGLLGILRVRNEINCYASVTGASTNLCTGDLYQS